MCSQLQALGIQNQMCLYLVMSELQLTREGSFRWTKYFCRVLKGPCLATTQSVQFIMCYFYSNLSLCESYDLYGCIRVDEELIYCSIKMYTKWWERDRDRQQQLNDIKLSEINIDNQSLLLPIYLSAYLQKYNYNEYLYLWWASRVISSFGKEIGSIASTERSHRSEEQNLRRKSGLSLVNGTR